MTTPFDQCLGTMRTCIAAAERCAAICGSSGDRERERCAALARDCADIGRMVDALMLRGSPFAAEGCALHAESCDALADYCARWPGEACCREAMQAARACAVECRACAPKEAA